MPTKPGESLFIPGPKLNRLRIMQQIAANPHLTQLELAQRCSLSAAMVNNYMKGLCGEGLLEYRRKSSKTVSYHLTPEGREAAAATGQRLIQELIRLFADAKERVRDVIRSNADGEFGRVVLYGSGNLAELVFHALDASDVSIVGVCDDTPAKIGRDWCGREILNPSQIRFIAPDSVVITDIDRSGEIFEGLSYLLKRGVRIIRLDGFGAGPLHRSGVTDKDGHEGPLLSLTEKAI